MRIIIIKVMGMLNATVEYRERKMKEVENVVAKRS